MIDCGSLEYAQARIQARHGQRADELAWQRLETAREFAALLEVARQTPLRHWLVGITAPAAPHRIEAALRAQWRAAVDEVASWMPAPWQAALRWCAVLPDLPVLQHLAQGEQALGWMDDDPDYRALAAVPVAQRHAAVRAAARSPRWPRPGWPPSRWRRRWHAEWLRRLPQPLQHGESRPGAGGDRAARSRPGLRRGCSGRPGLAAAPGAAGAPDPADAPRQRRGGAWPSSISR